MVDLNSDIEFLFKMIDNLSKNIDGLNPISRRLYLMGVISEMIPIITDLGIINDRLSSELTAEDARLKSLSSFCEDIGIGSLKTPHLDSNDEEGEGYVINYITDLFPLDDKNYKFTSENLDRLKTGMRMLCSEANISDRDINFAFVKGMREICGLLYDIHEKKKRIKSERYEDFWYQIESRDGDLYIEEAQADYDRWREDHDNCDIQNLRDKVTQEILKLLETGIFNQDTTPTNRDIKNSVIKISDDALEPDMIVPDGIEIECARFSKYVSFKEDILVLDYKALGKYIYKHMNKISDEQIDALIYFNFMLWPIHHDMTELNPKLKKYLPYSDDNTNEMLEWATNAIMSCKDLLASGVKEDILKEYISGAFYEDSLHLSQRLSGQSKYTTICRMVGMLKDSRRVFKEEIVDIDLAKSLVSVFEKDVNTLRRYVNQKNISKDRNLSEWTTNFIKENFYSDKEKIFVDISKI